MRRPSREELQTEITRTKRISGNAGHARMGLYPHITLKLLMRSISMKLEPELCDILMMFSPLRTINLS
jgi:hypothetical protein